MKTTVLEASVKFIEQPFLKPMQISSGLISRATEALVTVRARVGEWEGVGHGSIYLSDLWAWPGSSPDRQTKDASMRALCHQLANSLAHWCGGEEEHPLELGLRLHHSASRPEVAPGMPLLAKAVCASPFDAALHDAVGDALGLSAFRFYDAPCPIPSADPWFDGESVCEILRQTLLEPVNTLAAWWIVTAGDDLENSVRPAVAKNGISCFKIKVLGKDNAQDAARTSEVFRAAQRWGIIPTLSLDSNEANPDAASVLDYLDCLKGIDSQAYAALAYLEQPTGRDITASPQDWHSIGERKPVMLDEGLTSLDLLPAAKEQGWSGLALKTCKGHSFALVCAAWARQNNVLLSLQDLTNPGYAAIHSFLLGAHLPTINGVELNSPQYTPAANQPWLPRLSSLFAPEQGIHRLDQTATPGLGSSL